MLSPATPSSHEQRHSPFVGRSRELQEFRDQLALLRLSYTDYTTSFVPAVFLLQGATGTGKSALLHQWALIGAELLGPARALSIDLYGATYPTRSDLAQAISDSIQQQQPIFGVRFAQLLARRGELEQRHTLLTQQWALWEALRRPDENPDALLAMLAQRAHGGEQADEGGELSVFRAALDRHASAALTGLLAFYQAYGNAPTSLAALVAHDLGDDNRLLHDEEPLLQAFIDDLRDLAQQGLLLLTIDSFEQAGPHATWLRSILQPTSMPGLLTVIASRERLDDAYRQLLGTRYGPLVRSYDLDQRVLEYDEVRHYTEARLGEAATQQLVEQIVSASGRIPVLVEAFVAQVAAYGTLPINQQRDVAPGSPAAIIAVMRQNIVHDWLLGKHSPLLVHAQHRADCQRLRALALLRHADAQTVAAMWDMAEHDAELFARELAERYGFLFDAKPFALHPLVVEAVRQDVRSRKESTDHSALYQGLRRTQKLLRERLWQLERATPELRARYTLPLWRDTQSELIQLLAQLGDDDTAFRLLLNWWLEAQYADLPTAQALAKLAGTLTTASPDWRLLLPILQTRITYRAFAPYTRFMQPRSRAILYYLQAQQHGGHDSDDDRREQINRRIGVLEQGHRIDPGWEPLRDALTAAYANSIAYQLLRQEYMPTLADFDRALALQPNNLELLYWRAVTKAQLHDFGGALEDFDLFLAAQPGDAQLLYMRGVTKAQQHDLIGALADFDQALMLHAENPHIWYRRGVAAGMLGDLEVALANIDRAVALHAQAAPPWLYKRGLIRGALGDLAGALDDFDAVLQRRPGDVDLVIRRGRTRARNGDLAGALADFEQALRQRPNDLELLQQSGRVRVQQGDLTGALLDFEQVLRRHPEHTDLLQQRAMLRYELQDVAGALVDLDEVVRRSPNDADALRQRGKVKLATNDLRGAIDDFVLALSQRPGDLDTIYQRALATARLGDLTGALRDFTRVLSERPDDPDALFNRGVTRGELGDLTGALSDYDQALAIRPDDVDALYSRLVTRAELGDVNGALFDIDHVLRLRPNDPDTLFQRGLVRGKIKDWYGALADFDAVLQQHPDDADAWFQRGLARYALRDTVGAVADFDQALALRPNDPEFTRQRSKVKGLLGRSLDTVASYVRPVAERLGRSSYRRSSH
jgi:tetratricopeptide (TPR) repeat protein